MHEVLSYEVAGVPCAATLYLPPGPGPHPAVVLGHGLGGVAAYLEVYARNFVASGSAALTFDYRHFGRSGGRPRHLFSASQQLLDWEAAIAQARARPEIDAQRVALWGASFGGGHALTIAARHPELRAVVAQCPAVDFRALFVRAFRTAPRRALRLGGAALLDAAFGLVGSARYVPLVGPPEAVATMTVPFSAAEIDTMMHEAARQLAEPPVFVNELTPRFLLSVALYRPIVAAAQIKAPLLVIVADEDTVAPPDLAIAAARRAPQGQVSHYAADHFSIFNGEHLARCLGEQAHFVSAAMARPLEPTRYEAVRPKAPA